MSKNSKGLKNTKMSACCRWGYRGVIIGWDETARAPKEWLEQMHKDNPTWRHQPNYAVLVDTRDRPAPQLTYVPQVVLSPWPCGHQFEYCCRRILKLSSTQRFFIQTWKITLKTLMALNTSPGPGWGLSTAKTSEVDSDTSHLYSMLMPITANYKRVFRVRA